MIINIIDGPLTSFSEACKYDVILVWVVITVGRNLPSQSEICSQS